MIRLKELRKKKGINQKQIADLLKVSQGQVSMFENEVNHLNSQQIIDLVKVLECSADYLLGLIDNTNHDKDKKSR